LGVLKQDTKSERGDEPMDMAALIAAAKGDFDLN
jgi:hypothetical protein